MTHEALLRALPTGGVMWLPARGKSLWPLLRDGDSLRVQRLDEAALKMGDVAVVKLPGDILAAHIVVALNPLRTASSVGVVDAAALEVLARVTGFRRRGATHEWPALAASVLRWLPRLSRSLKRVPGARSLARLLRD